jgi:membrane-bound lytic murein transglycosylase D
MSARLRLAVLAALGLALPCAAVEPAITTVPVFAPIADQRVPPSPLLPPLLVPPPPAATAVAPEAPVPVHVDSIPVLRSGQEVFARLRRGLSPQACEAGGNSTRWRKRYAGSPVTFSRRIESVLPMLDFVATEVERAGLPAEFAFIPLVESWYQPGAIGVGGPAGMWQMIGTTAKNHGIHIRPGYDGRLSPVESTRAALSYLNVLKGMFDNWQAIVMAYNAGEGRMLRAMRRAGSRSADAAQRRPHGLSNITYDYVDKLQALSCLVQQPQRQNVRLPLEATFEPLVPVLVEDDIGSLEQFAALHGKDPGQLRRLNPGFRQGRIIAGVPRLLLSTPRLELPPPALVEGSAPSMAVAALQSPGPALSATTAPVMVPAAVVVAGQAPAVNPDPPQPVHEVRAGDTIDSIAAHYQLPVEQLLHANDLRRDAELRPGQRLRLVP